MSKGGRLYKVHEDLIALGTIVEEGDFGNIVRIVKEHGIDAHDGFKRTAVMWAAYSGKVELLRWLFANGADPNTQDREGYTALHFCGSEQQYESAKILLEYGGDPNIQDEHGNPPLWTAIFNCKEDFSLVKLLLSSGANPDQKNKYGSSPKDLARTIHDRELSELEK